MNTPDLCYLSLAQVADLLRTRKVSPVELAQATLARAERLQPVLNAFILLDGDALLDAARQAEAEIGAGRYRGPLHGVPVSLKDLFDVAGRPTTAGSKSRGTEPAGAHATVWQRLEAAGALLVGKTNLHELAYGATTVNPHFGPTRNPWDTTRVPGGSSGGSAAAVSAGASFISIGSDTGGSIRCPAALCGITGLKPTYGRVSRAGALPLSWAQDHVGPLARTATDCAIVLDAVAGPDASDPSTLGVPAPRAVEQLQQAPHDLRGLRVGVLSSHRRPVLDRDVDSALDRAIAQLADLGAEVEDVELPEERDLVDAGVVILMAEAAAVHLPGLRARPEEYGSDVRGRLEAGALIPAVDYLDAQRARRKLVPQALRRLSAVDVVVGPTVPIGAPAIETRSIRMGDRDVDPRTVLLHATRLFDVTGQPAASVPCGFTDDGLPIGLQIAGQPWQEGLVLRVAHTYQQATDWHRHRPPLD